MFTYLILFDNFFTSTIYVLDKLRDPAQTHKLVNGFLRTGSRGPHAQVEHPAKHTNAVSEQAQRGNDAVRTYIFDWRLEGPV